LLRRPVQREKCAQKTQLKWPGIPGCSAYLQAIKIALNSNLSAIYRWGPNDCICNSKSSRCWPQI
jgi:hypothetical protein